VRPAVLLLAAALAAWATARAQSPTQAPPQLQSPAEVVDAFHAGLREGNRRKALEQLTADVVVFEQGRIDRTRTEYARRHLAEDIGFASVTQRTVSRRAVKIHGNVAWVTSVNRAKGTFKNRAVDFSTDETLILVLSAGRWRIAHIHWSFDDQAIH
jgi:ketosteroid isomerase-like protein